ncbi:MAG: hypothetical protein O7G86_20435 [Gammaproteobacteria bacterium]|nr:hypothetical protein [Gammaproteobacteria bacterium]MCZ6856291.1 hypothetical protein [Gammaproteobacteria bacterium]
MKNKLISLFICLMALGLAFSGVAVQAAEAPPPVVLETFACNYHDGKDMDDLLSARDYMVKQAGKAGLSLAPGYVWSKYKGGPDLDHIWFTVHESLAAFAAESEAFGSAPELAGVGARFDTVASCDSNIAMARAIFQGSEAGPPVGSAFISSNACMFHDGVDASDMADLEGHLAGVLGEMSAYNSTTFISATPFTSGPDSADVYLFSINASQSAWAAGVTAFQASASGPALLRHLNSLLDCDTSLWFSEQVVGEAD